MKLRAEAPSGAALTGLRRFTPEAWAARRGIHYGWVVVAVTFLVVAASAGVRALPGPLIQPLEREFGWSRGEISLAIAVSWLFYGVAAPLSAYVADRLGLRAMTLVFLVTSGIGVALRSEEHTSELQSLRTSRMPSSA